MARLARAIQSCSALHPVVDGRLKGGHDTLGR